MSNSEKDKPKFHYAIIPDKLLNDSSISDEAKVTYAIFYQFSKYKKSDNPITFYPLGYYAKKRGVHKRSIQRALADLKEAGWVTNIRRYNEPSVICLHKRCIKKKSKGQNSKG